MAAHSEPAPLRQRVDRMAILAALFGVLSFVWLPIIGAVLALGIGFRSSGRIDSDPGLRGRSLATIAIVLGVANLVLRALALVFGVVVHTGSGPLHVSRIR